VVVARRRLTLSTLTQGSPTMKRFLATLAVCLSFALPAHAQRMSMSWQQVQFTATAGAYSAGQCLGGVLAVPNMVRSGGPGGAVLAGVSFLDSAHNTAANDAMTLLVFGAKPTGTYTDQAGCAIASADRASFIGQAVIASANCNQDSGPATTVCTITPNLALSNINGAGASTTPPVGSTIWVVPVVTATPTYGAITLFFNFLSTPFSGN
jgi:hypothetical protein